MVDIQINNAIVQDISLLYELSLSIGSSIDLEKNCKGFIKTLMSRKNLEIASVWIKSKYLNDRNSNTYKLVFASPISRHSIKEIDHTHKIISIINEMHNNSLVINNTNSEFYEIITEKNITKGSYAILKIQDKGFIKIYTSIRENVLTRRELQQLQSVINKFSVSIEGCLSHITAIKELIEIKNLEEREKKLAKLPEENSNPVLRILKSGEIEFANKASELILDYWNVSVGNILPQKYLVFIQSSYLNKISKIIKVDCGKEIYSLRLEPIIDSNYINIYGHKITQQINAQNELQKLKIFYEQTLNELPEQLTVIDSSLNYIFVNPKAIPNKSLRLWMIGKNDFDYCREMGFSEKIALKRQDRLKLVIRKEEPIQFEEIIQNENGDILHLLRIIYPVIDENNNVSKILAYGLDITDRKKVEFELRKSEEKYKEIFNSIQDVYVEFDAKTDNITEISPSVENVLSIQRNEIIGQRINTFYEDKNVSKNLLNKLIEKGSVSDYEIRFMSYSGEILTTSFSGKVIFDENGDAHKIYGTIRDISERINSEKIIRDNEKKYRLLLEYSGSAINYFDKTGKILLANSISAKSLGKLPNELIGKSMYEVLPKNIVDSSKRRYVKIMKSGRGAEYEDLIELKGVKKWFSSSIQPVKDDKGEMIGIQSISNDITDRKHNEQELKKSISQNIAYSKELSKTIYYLKKSEKALTNSQKQLSSVLNTVGEGIITFDSNENIILVNYEACKMFEYEQKELIGKNIGILFELDCKSKIAELVEASIKGNNIEDLCNRVEVEGIRSGIIYFPISLKITETQIENKPYFTVAVHDISELDLLVKDLERSNKALSEFAYIASHDLKEPLRKIVSFGNILEESLTNIIDDDNKENLKYMIDGAKRMHLMVEDLLAYSRLSSQKIKLVSIDLDELVDGIIKFELSVLIEETNAKIEIESKLGFINGEPTQIKQLFQNLIENGIKYRKENINPIIQIRVLQYKRATVLEIEDNGIGIASEYQSQIFEMFKRLHTKDKYSGSGIGLSLCKKIVDLHGGEIGVQSKQGEFSIFWISFS